MLDCRTNSSSNINDRKSVGIIKILKYNYYCMICKYYYFNNLNEFYLHFNNVHKNMILNNNNDEAKTDKNCGNHDGKVSEVKLGVNMGQTKSNSVEPNGERFPNNAEVKKDEEVKTRDSENNTKKDYLDDPIENEVNEIVDKITTIASTEIGQR